MVKRQALFRFDAGLLFVVAGLALCAAAVLLPAQQDLFSLQQQLDELRKQDDLMRARLHVTAEVLRELDRDNPDLQRRLISSQLNLAPAGDTPIVLVTSRKPDVSEWIAERVHVDSSTVVHSATSVWPDTMLSQLVDGPYRLWILGGSVLCVFIGLMHSTATFTRSRADEACHELPCDTNATLQQTQTAQVFTGQPSGEIDIDHNDQIDDADAIDVADDLADVDECCEISMHISERNRPILTTALDVDEPAGDGNDRDNRAFPKSLFD
jgi:uncharacterized membrane-anchored protein YhcB (DUF1043 family)